MYFHGLQMKFSTWMQIKIHKLTADNRTTRVIREYDMNNFHSYKK